MAFPQTPLDARIDLLVDGAWSNITSDVLVRDGVTITRGRADEAARVDPSSTSLTLENRDGRYSPRNPVGALYGKIGRNTRLRVGVGSPPAGAATPDLSGSSFAAPSVTAEAAGTLFCVWGASLDGDFTGPAGFAMGTVRHSDVTSWNGGTKAVSAGATGTSTATYSLVADHAVALSVVVPGVSAFSGFSNDNSAADTTVAVTGITGGDYLLAVQGWSADAGDDMTVTPSLAGQPTADWTLLADSGSSANLRIRAWICRLPASAASTETVRFPGPPSLGVDNYGRVWRLTTATGYTARHVGEVSTWPQRWDLSGADVHTPVTSSGILRRLGQGAAPLRSSLTRHITLSRDVVAYWPCEDADGSATLSSPVSGVESAEFRGTPALATDETFACSEPLPTWQAAGFVGKVPSYTATGELFAGALFSIPAGGMALSGPNLLSVGLVGGTISRAIMEYRTTGDLAIKLVDKSNATVVNTSFAFDFDGDRFFAWLSLEQAGADITWRICAIGIVEGATAPTVGLGSGTAAAQTLGRARTVTAGIEGDANGPLSLTAPVTIGHVTVASRAQAVFRSDFTYYYPALVGWASESATARIIRLCREESIDVLGHYTTTATALGAQRAGGFVDLLEEAAAADGGILYEPRGFLGLAYRPRVTRENRTADVTLTYSSKHIAEPFEPVDDDQATRNDVTVTRIGGASARAERTTGPLSVLAPPLGVGRYDAADEVSLWRDSQAADVAGWRLHLGTWDAARYPSVAVDLAAAPSIVDSVAALDCGSQVALTGLPAWLPPGPVDVSVEGYSETLDPFGWMITFNASPAGPYRVAELDSADFGRLDSDDSTLSAGVTSSATSFSVATDTSRGAPLWITTASHPTEFPFDATVGGEVVRVTAITGTTSPQTWTVTRSINGVSKSHSSGVQISLNQPVYVPQGGDE